MVDTTLSLENAIAAEIALEIKQCGLPLHRQRWSDLSLDRARKARQCFSCWPSEHYGHDRQAPT